jgi:hypothetical protein
LKDEDEMITYSTDISPKFRAKDTMCMDRRGIRLDDADWMCDPAAAFGFKDHGNARHVFERLSAGTMPPDGAWSGDWLKTYQSWMNSGFSR